MKGEQKWEAQGAASEGGTILVLLQGSHDQIGMVWFHQDETGRTNLIIWNTHTSEPRPVPEHLIKDFQAKEKDMNTADVLAWVRKHLEEITRWES